MEWVNLFGLGIVVLMLIPNLIYACKHKQAETERLHPAMNLLEQVGRYGSMFLMVFNIGVLEFGFKSKLAFTVWLLSIAFLLMAYWLLWFFYFQNPNNILALSLAVIPSTIFILSGLLLWHWLLVLFGFVFSLGHIFITVQNNRTE